MRRIDLIIIHHTVSPRDTTTIKQITEWHMEKFGGSFDGWIGYHYVILGGGEIIKTRPNGVVGMHAYGSNYNSIGIALAGNFKTESPSTEQVSALTKLLKELYTAYWPVVTLGHKDTWWARIKPTLCPGKNLYEVIGRINKKEVNA